MNYEDFCHIASVCTEQIGPKCRRFFSPSNFMKFEKDESGRIAILPFYLYVMRTVGPALISLYVFFLFSACFFYLNIRKLHTFYFLEVNKIQCGSGCKSARVPNDLQTRATAKLNYFYTRVCHSKIYYNFHKMSDWAFEPLPTTSWPVQWYLCLYFLLSIIFWYGSLFGGKWKSSLLRYTQGLSWKPSPWPVFYSSYSLLYKRVKE